MSTTIAQLLKKYKGLSFEDEDGNELNLELRSKVSTAALKKFEKQEEVQLPDDLKQLYLISDGVDLFGVEIASLDELLYDPDHDAFQFHNWGDGSFDYITPAGKICFLDNHSKTLFPVSDSLGKWMQGVVAEIQDRGVLMQPDDYSRNSEDEGLYYSAYAAISKKAGAKSKKNKITPKPKASKNEVAANVQAWDEIKKKFSDKKFNLIEERIAKQNKGKIFRGNPPAFIAMMREDFRHSAYPFNVAAEFAARNETVIAAFAKAYWPKKNDWEECVMGYTIYFGLFLCYMKEGKEKELLSFLKKSHSHQAGNEMKRIKRSYAAVKASLQTHTAQ